MDSTRSGSVEGDLRSVDPRVSAVKLWTRRQMLARGGAAVAGAALLAACGGDSGSQSSGASGGGTEDLSGTLSLLAWTGYEEDGILDPFREQTGLDVRVKTFLGDDEMISILRPSQGVYDAVIVGPEYVQQLTDKLRPLESSEFDLSHYLPTFQNNISLNRVDDTTYAVPARWGANSIAYNTDELTAEDADSYEVLTSPDLKGRVGIWDWYLPTMGTLSAALNNEEPYFLDDAAYAELIDYMGSIRQNVGAIFPTPAEMTSGMGSGQVWAIPAGADWVAALLAAEGRPVNWSVPSKGFDGAPIQYGGIMWSEGVAITNDAPNPDAALAYLQYMTTPEANALMATRQAYQSQVCSADAIALLPDDAKEILHSRTADAVEDTASRLYVRQVPEDAQMWQDSWSEFKAS